MRPPRVARTVLWLVVRPADRPFLFADLQEDFEALSRDAGAGVARRWYRHQVVSSIAPSLRRRCAVAWREAVQRYARRRGDWTMDGFLQDIGFAARTLRKSPGFALVAAATLAIGIGANVTIFSLVNGVFFTAVPHVVERDRVVELSRDIENRFWDVSYPVFLELRGHDPMLRDLAALQPTPLALGGPDGPSVHMGLSVTGNYFSLLGVTPARGRFFGPDESFFPTVQPVVVLGHAVWQRVYSGREDIVGATVRVNGHPVQVIGIAPEGFGGHRIGDMFQVFVPLGVAIPGLESPRSLRQAQSGVLELLGRLGDGVLRETAAETLSRVATRFHQANTQSSADYVVRVEPWSPVPAGVRRGATAFFALLMGVVGLVLTMACVNVANMLLSRATERRGEIGVRLAMGARPSRVVRQLLTESLLLFAVAGGIGIVLAQWGVGLLMAFEPPLPAGLTVDLHLGIDWRVLLFALGLSLTTGVVFSLTPALRAGRSDLLAVLRDRAAIAPNRARLRSLMVGVQMAITVLLLVVAGLFLRTVSSMKSLDPGWEAEGVYAMAIDLELNGTGTDRGLQFYRELMERVREVPGVDASALAGKLPLAGRSSLGAINVANVTPPEGTTGFEAFFNRVSGGHFHTLGLEMIRGRDFTSADTDGRALVAVVNRSMADRFWPGGGALGKRFYAGEVGSGIEFTVVGVVEDASYRRVVEATPNFFYLPYQQRYNAQMHLFVRSDPGGRPGLLDDVRGVVKQLDPHLPIQTFQPLAALLEAFFLPQRVAAWVAGVMGALGLLLGSVGVYGVTSFAVSQRTREIGVRIALGANTWDVRRLMVLQGMRAPAVGIVLGLAFALATTRVLAAFLPGVNQVDLATFSSVVLLLIGVAGIATAIPADRAARLNPMTTLKTE